MRRSSGKSDLGMALWNCCAIAEPSTSRIDLSYAADIGRSQCAFRPHTRHCTNPSLISGIMERSSQRVIHAYAHVRTNQVLYSFTPYIHVRFPIRQSPSSTQC